MKSPTLYSSSRVLLLTFCNRVSYWLPPEPIIPNTRARTMLRPSTKAPIERTGFVPSRTILSTRLPSQPETSSGGIKLLSTNYIVLSAMSTNLMDGCQCSRITSSNVT